MDTNEIAIAVYNPQPGTNVMMIRREMAQLSVVKKSLTSNEMLIFQSSATRPFFDYGDVELINKCREIFDFIAGDVGYNKQDNIAWGKIMVRFAMILRQYYPTFTADDVLMAFEFLVVGQLDAYLPKDSSGNPDRKHYQQFNVEYLSKVLNAYRRERCRVIQKAQQAIPKPERRITIEEKRHYHNEMCASIIRSFLLYKYTGRLNCGSSIGEMLTYNALAELGFVEAMEIGSYEQKEMIDSAIGNRKNVSEVAKNRRRLLRKAFDEMIDEEIQITDYIMFT